MMSSVGAMLIKLLVLSVCCAAEATTVPATTRASSEFDQVEAQLAKGEREAAIREFTRITHADDPVQQLIVRQKINDAADALLREVDDLLKSGESAKAT